MIYGVELLDSDGTVLAGPKSIAELAVPFLRDLAVESDEGNISLIVPLKVPGDNNDLSGEPALFYRSPEIGYIYVSIKRGERALYRHPHSVGEVLEPGIRRWLENNPLAIAPVGYRIAGSGILSIRAAPRIEGVANVKAFGSGETPAFRIKQMPEPPLATATLASLGAAPVPTEWRKQGRSELVKVVLDKTVQADLAQTRDFSREVEEGGFLLGRVFEDSEQPGTYLVHVTQAPNASSTGASLLHFTFTGDSFREVNATIGTGPSRTRILGWYHTHLFEAKDDMGLSSIDVRLHFTTFRIPWQLAGLVNLEAERRVLRFYVRDHDNMALCHHQEIDAMSGGGSE